MGHGRATGGRHEGMGVSKLSRLYPVILSGGSGSRLWPLSREEFPKQLQPLTSERSLLQETALRLGTAANGVKIEPPIVVCNETHRFIVAEQLRAAGIEPRAEIGRASCRERVSSPV